MNVNQYNTKNYENKSNWTLGENKPNQSQFKPIKANFKANSNPIKPNFKKAKMNVNLTLTKDYRKKDDFAVRKNKPNSNPISVKAKMNVNSYSTKDYENKPRLSAPGKQTQTNPISRHSVRKETYDHENVYPSYFYEGFIGCCW